MAPLTDPNPEKSLGYPQRDGHGGSPTTTPAPPRCTPAPAPLFRLTAPDSLPSAAGLLRSGHFGPPTPTGVVFSKQRRRLSFENKASPHFIFVTEDGTISAWNAGTSAELEVDNSDKDGSSHGAVYKSATSGEINGKKYLYVAISAPASGSHDTTFSACTSRRGCIPETMHDCDREPIATSMETARAHPRRLRLSTFRTSAAACLSPTPKQDGIAKPR